MDVYGKEEKEIIDEIVTGEGYSRNLINILSNLSDLKEVRISVSPTANSARFDFEASTEMAPTEEVDIAVSKADQITQKLITHLLILERLDNKELAFFYDPASYPTGDIVFGEGSVNMPSITIPIYDQKIINLLKKYLRYEIVPKPALIHLRKNKYKNDERIRFDKQICATWAALAVSIILGLYGVFSNYYGGKSTDKKFDQVISSIESSIDKIEISLGTLKQPNANYSTHLQEISASMSLISRDLATISTKNLIVNLPEITDKDEVAK